MTPHLSRLTRGDVARLSRRDPVDGVDEVVLVLRTHVDLDEVTGEVWLDVRVMDASGDVFWTLDETLESLWSRW